ncbi:hypothetical protein, partial, partial [Parasitella parasitica]
RKERDEQTKQQAEQTQQKEEIFDDEEDELVKDEIQAEKDSETSIKRINVLVSVARSALFGTDRITKGSLPTQLIDISLQEAQVAVNILGFIKPYVLPRSKYHILSYQLPFVLMANRVLTAIEYQGQTVQLAPIVKPTKLHALRLDASTLKANSIKLISNVKQRLRVW